MLEYILISITAIIILYFAYIKIRYPFWNIQPVYHTYNWWRRSPTIVYRHRPVQTKFMDLINIYTETYLDKSEDNREKMLNLIQSCYNSSNNSVYYIKSVDINAYFAGQYNPSIISIYNEPQYTKQTDTVQTPILVPYGVITSRALKFYIRESLNENIYIDYNIYFIDFIGVHREKTEQIKIRRKLLQTHEYNQRTKNPTIAISLIKKDKELFDGIVPLVKYDTFVYKLIDFKLPKISLKYSILQLTEQNINDYNDFFYNNQEMSSKTRLFDTMIFPDVGNILLQLKTRNLYIFCIKNKENVLGFYFFKNEKIYDEELDCNTLRCISSIMNCNNTEVFFLGFLYSLRKIIKLEADYKILIIEDLCHNNIIHNLWKMRYSPSYTYQSAYYLYNYIYPGSPLPNDRCFIIH